MTPEPIEIQVNKTLATIGKRLIDEGRYEEFALLSKTLESCASIIRDCALMAHGLTCALPIMSDEWKQAANLERELNVIAAELRKERKA